MDKYVTSAVIRRLREAKKLTQEELAERLFVSSKAVSKWETGRGFPDVSLLEPLAEALGISVIELLSGEDITNANRAFDMHKLNFYICPVCGNIITSTGKAVVSCCGITLPPAEAEPEDAEHRICVEAVEDEYYVSSAHPMTRGHYISFIAAVSDSGCQLAKLYPEGEAGARFKKNRIRYIYAFCNRHGLFRVDLRKLLHNR